MIRKLTCILFILAIGHQTIWGQVGGNRTYEFLNIPYSAGISGLGGVNVSLAGQDVNLFLSNPALTTDTLLGYASANYLSYFADIGLATFTYARKVDRLGGMFSVGIQHIGLGTIDGYDAIGNTTQPFTSGETALTLSHSRKAGNFRAGVNMKFVTSNIASYRSNALLFDLGGVFIHPHKQLNVGLVIKNAGFVLSEYTTTSESKPPLDIQLGITFKPEHMPIRVSITAYQFVNGERDIAYYDASSSLQTDKPGGFDKVARHFVVGGELLLSKNVNVRFGYNHLVRKELSLESGAGGAGFSFGFMFRVKAIEFAYSRGGYHVAGGAHHFTMAFNTNNVLRRNKTK